MADKCVQCLWETLKTKIPYVVQEAVIVIRDIFRKYPNKYESIIATLGSAYGARQVSTIFTPSNDYQVILEVLPEFQSSPAAILARLSPVPSPSRTTQSAASSRW